MNRLTGKRILVTGASGRVGAPMCKRLVADDNEVWGICRYSRPGTRERLDGYGVNTRVVELYNPDFSELPGDFDHVIHLGAAVVELNDEGVMCLTTGTSFDRANEVNGIGTGQLMSRFRNAQSMLLTSTTGVYRSSENEEDHLKLAKEDDVQGIALPPTPQYSVSKQGQEVIARFCAQEFGLPTTIARMGCQATAEPRSWSDVFITLLKNGLPVPVLPKGRRQWYQFIHDDDLYDHLGGLLNVASVDPPIFNWTGTEVVDMAEVVEHIAARMGVDPNLAEDDSGVYCKLVDTSKLIERVGPCKLGWKEAWDRVLDEALPEHAAISHRRWGPEKKT